MNKLSRAIDIEKTTTGYSGKFFAMASPCECLFDSTDEGLARHLTEIASAEAWRIEEKFSRYNDHNIIHRIHHAQGTPIEVDQECVELFNFADQCFDLSDGLFDISSGVLREIWRFDGSDKVPSRKQAKTYLNRIGWNKISWEAPYISVPEGMQIDLGGFGKEYAVDCTAKLLMGQTDCAFLVNYGGDLFANKAPANQTSWQVGVEYIKAANSTRKKGTQQIFETAQNIIPIMSGGIATSGDANRFLLKDGIRYPHVVNPKTAWPVVKAPSSITVIADNCIQAGFIATMAMLKGKNAEAFLESQGMKFFIQW